MRPGSRSGVLVGGACWGNVGVNYDGLGGDASGQWSGQGSVACTQESASDKCYRGRVVHGRREGWL